MLWLDINGSQKQAYVTLRMSAPESEVIWLDFQPLKMSCKPGWDPMWEEWHCYYTPLRIYKQDYKILLDYFGKIYPIHDAFSGTLDLAFDVCFSNWIGKSDWLRIIEEIERDLVRVDDRKRVFLTDFLAWLQNALADTSVIVVEGNQ